MKIKHAIALSAILLAGNAHAYVFTMGSFSTGSADYTDSAMHMGNFTDFLNFSVGSATTIKADFADQVSQLDLSLFGGSGFISLLNINGLDVDLYQGTGGMPGAIKLADFGSGDSFINSVALGTGNYYFKVTGTGAGLVGGPTGSPSRPCPSRVNWPC